MTAGRRDKASRDLRPGHPELPLGNPASIDPAAPTRWLAPDPGGLWEVADVVGVEPETVESTTLRLTLPEVPELLPGQYYLVRLATRAHAGVGAGAVQQAFSVSSSPYPPTRTVAITVREVPGGRVSPHLAHKVRVGDQLHLHGPYGFLTWTEEDGGPLVLIGAGSGVAPLMSIVRYAVARKASVPMVLLCSSRDRSRVLFRAALEELDQRTPWLSVVHTFTRNPGDELARYHRRVDATMIDEVIHSLALSPGDRTANVSYLVAGSAGMVGAVRTAMRTLGVADGSVASENHA